MDDSQPARRIDRIERKLARLRARLDGRPLAVERQAYLLNGQECVRALLRGAGR